MPSRVDRPERFSRQGLLAALVVGALFVGVLVHFIALVSAHERGILAQDLVWTYLPAAEAVLDGESPYPPTDYDVATGYGYVYPPLVAIATTPLALVPHADVIGTVGSLLCVLGALWLLGVRDWRCYPAALLWAPVFHAVQTVNVTLLLVLGAAACWRLRERPASTALVGGLAVATKPIVWPLGLWLAATRRWTAAVGAAVVALVAALGSWAALGFDGLRRYPDFVERMSEEMGEVAYTVPAVLANLGAPQPLVAAVGAAVASLAVLGVVVYGRRGDDARSFACAMLLVVTATPVVWLHYLAFLLPAVAVLRPRLSWVWFVPAVGWIHTGSANGDPLQTGVTVAACLLAVLVSMFSPVVQSAPRLRTAIDSSR